MDWVTGEVETTLLPEGRVTSQTVLEWLERLAERALSRQKPIVLVLDNASIHTAKIVKDKLEDWKAKGLYIGLLPAYSPQLNPMECIWRLLKYHLLERRCYPDLAALKAAIEAVLARLRLPPLPIQTILG